MAPLPSFPMHEMTKLEWVLNNPEWMNLLTTVLLAFITTSIIGAQAVFSLRAQRRQNDLLKYQLEYTRMQSLNAVREETLALLSTLRRCRGLLEQGSGDGPWYDMEESFYSLYDKVSRLDSSIYNGYYDGWYANLSGYVDEMFLAMKNDSKTDGAGGTCPTEATIQAFDAAESKWNPLNIMSEIQYAIRTTGSLFHERWNDLLPLDRAPL